MHVGSEVTLPTVTNEPEYESFSRSRVSSGEAVESAGDTEESSISANVRPSSNAASVGGRVLDSFDRPVSAVRVALYQGRLRRETTTDQSGRFHFRDLSLGLHRLFVVPESLADGFLPPWRQSQARAYDGVASGIGGTSFSLKAGSKREVDLRVFSSAQVTGVVTGPASEAVEGALVTLWSRNGVQMTARSNREGNIRFEGAYPGDYIVHVEAPAGRLDYAGLSPLPFEFELNAGENRELPALEFGEGGSQLVGRVVDEEGIGIPGLVVQARSDSSEVSSWTWRSATDSEGRYRIGRLPAVRVRLELQADETYRESSAEPRVVECTGADEVLAIDDWQVDLLRPFEVQCKVEVDAAWAKRVDLAEYSLELREANAPSSLESGVARHWIDPARAEFRWSCPTPSAPVTLAVVLADPYGQQHTRELRIVPLANGKEERVLHFP